MAGRPTAYTPEVETEIFERLAEGESLRAICNSKAHLPAAPTIRSWIVADKPPGISARYACARAAGLDSIAEQMSEISDNLEEDANSRRVRIDTRKWLLSKMAPKKYGDRIEIAGDAENPLNVNVTQSTEQLAARIDSLITRSRTPELPEKPE